MTIRSKRSSEYTPEQIEKQIKESQTTAGYRDATKKGIVSGLVVYLVVFFIFFVLFVATGELIYLDSFYPTSLIIVAIFFFFSGTAIWFVPSPSWNRMKSIIFRHPFIQKTTTDGFIAGWNRLITALTLLIMVEFQRFIDFKYFN